MNNFPRDSRFPSLLAGRFVRTLLLLTSCLSPATAQPPLTNPAPALHLRASATQVAQYRPLEFDVQGGTNYLNPFDPQEVSVDVELTFDGKHQITVPAFWFQDYERQRLDPSGRSRDWLYPTGFPRWKARFTPSTPGSYTAVVAVKDHTGTSKSPALSFVCLPSTNRGFVRVSRRDPRFLEFTTGQSFFPLGQNLAFIGSQQYVTLSKAEEIFTNLSDNGANYLRIWTGCEDWALAIEARKSAWGRSWDWRPPITPMPGQADTNHLCLKLANPRRTLDINPSHPVALRPNTAYLISGSVRTEPGASVALVVHGASPVALAGPSHVWQVFRHTFTTGPRDFWLNSTSFRLDGDAAAWIADLSLREEDGGPELLWEANVNRPIRGFYNPLDSFLLDQIVAAAEQNGIYLQLCLLTRDLYMDALKDPSSPAYDRAIADAQKFFRYAVARWGAATSVAAWEYWNEMNPGLPTDRFYSELGERLEQIDPYQHLRTTSTWGPSAKDCLHPKLDIADVHFYLRPPDQPKLRDEVDALLERTHWIRQQAPNKPAHLGEFGLADEKWRLTSQMKNNPQIADFHNTLWGSVLSGASGSAMPWWWERLDQRNAYPLYRPVAEFISQIPWNSGELKSAPAKSSDPNLRIIGLQSRTRAWLWVFHPSGAYANRVAERQTPSDLPAAEVELTGLPQPRYDVHWWNTATGKVSRKLQAEVTHGVLRLTLPAFHHDIACQILPSPL